MNIICCGSSFSSLDPKLPNTHFSELLAKELNAKLVNIAKPGSSNFAIRLQIDTAIKLKPDLILVEFASASRLDLPLSVLGEDSTYNSHNLANNLRYTNYFNVVPDVIDHTQESIISDSITNLIDANCFVKNEKLTDTSRQALRNWFTELYDENIAYHRDFYIASSAFMPLEQSKIPYLWTRGDLCMFDWSMYSNQVDDQGNPWLCDNMVSTTYHTTPEKQQEIATSWLSAYKLLRGD
jgi:hypothetical protein